MAQVDLTSEVSPHGIYAYSVYCKACRKFRAMPWSIKSIGWCHICQRAAEDGSASAAFIGQVRDRHDRFNRAASSLGRPLVKPLWT